MLTIAVMLGISGFHTMRVLLENPNRWKKIWAARSGLRL